MTRVEYDKLTPWQQGNVSYREAGTNPEIPSDCPYTRKQTGCGLWYSGWAAAAQQTEREQAKQGG